MRDIMEKREQSGDFGWTLCIYPTKALAEAAKLTMDEFKAQVVKACYLDDDNPPARWAEIFEEAEKVKAWLNGLPVEHLRITIRRTPI